MGKCLKLRPEDKALLIGSDAPAYKKGLLTAGNCESQIFVLNNINEIRKMLSEFSGNIFLQGSNSYQLWKLIPEASEKIERSILACLSYLSNFEEACGAFYVYLAISRFELALLFQHLY